MIRILHVLSSLNGGGVEQMLYNYYKLIDREKIVFDFVVHGDKIGALEKFFREHGSKIYHVTPKKESIIKNISEINRIIKSGNYDIVHCHQNFSSAPTLVIAKKNKVKVRIAHSHGCNPSSKRITKLINCILRRIIIANCTHQFACGEQAGAWLFGKKWTNNNKCFIMKNGIDINDYKFSIEARNEYRKKYNLDNQKVLLHIGRFSPEKNHEFLIEIMKKIKKPAILFLIGDGDLREKYERLVKDNKLEKNVIFLGYRNDVNNFISMADYLLFPSLNEGFGMVVIEAQASGLKSIVSENVPLVVKQTDLVKVCSLSNISEWVKLIDKEDLCNPKKRLNYYTMFKKNAYNIKNAVKEYNNVINSIMEE